MDEWEQGEVVVKVMASGKQHALSQQAAAELLLASAADSAIPPP